MRKYTTLLFDADMTLFNFEGAEKAAFGIAMISCGIEYNAEDFERYRAINSRLWERYAQGEITKEYLQANRFAMFFETFDVPPRADGVAANRVFVDTLADCSELFDGAIGLCRTLSEKYELYIVTNGVSHTQKKRFYASPICSYFKDIFVSEDAGAPKPMREYFDYVFSHIGEEKREGSVIIGDSLSSDIKGGNNAGIDTVWYNPRGNENTTEITPTKTVGSYKELLELLL